MGTLSNAALSLADFLRAEQLNFSFKISPERKKALDTIYDSELKRIENMFHINTTKFIHRLAELVESPYKIDQGNYGLCVTASFLYVIIKDYPEKFVAFAFELLAKGKAKFGALSINTSADFKAVDFPLVIKLERGAKAATHHEADYFLLGAFRDSINSFYNVKFNDKNQPAVDESFPDQASRYIKSLLIDDSKAYSGVSDELVSWFDETKLYKPTVQKLAGPTITEVELDSACKANETVILEVHTNGNINEFIPHQINPKKRHSCTIFSPSITFPADNKKMEFHLVTWGMIIPVECTKDAFKKALIGYLEVNTI